VCRRPLHVDEIWPNGAPRVAVLERVISVGDVHDVVRSARGQSFHHIVTLRTPLRQVRFSFVSIGAGVTSMQDSLGIAGTIWQALELLWNWSFGQVVTMFQMPLNTLPLWKQLLFLIVIGSLARLVYTVVMGLRKAAQSLVGATVGLVSVLLSLVP